MTSAERKKAAIERKIKRKFGNRQKLASKTKATYPADIEDERKKILLAIFALYYRTLDRYQDSFDRDVIYKEVMNRRVVKNSFKRIRENAEKLYEHQAAALNKQIKDTLGVELSDDLFDTKEMRKLVDEIAESDINDVKETVDKLLDAAEVIFERNRLRNIFLFLAVSRVIRSNAAITRQLHEQMGVSEYVWTTQRDNRVRDSHRRLDGRIFKYSEPPVMNEKSGERGNPGDDFGCRCVATPVFGINILEHIA